MCLPSIMPRVIVLALDSTTAQGSCALSVNGAVRALEGDRARSQAERLPGDLMTLLELEGVELKDVDCYAVATGPGSFTGLRVGIATMQGLAFATRRPLVGVSALDALAVIGSAQLGAGSPEGVPRIATWMDAWRGEIYAALYDRHVQVEAASVEPPDAVLTRFAGAPTLFIGDAVTIYEERIRRSLGAAGTIASPPSPPLAATIAAMARDRIAAGERPAPDSIRPLYVRRPDVELARDARTAR